MAELLAEAQRLPAGAVRRARGITWIKPPDHLADLLPRVRREHGSELRQLHVAIDARLAGQHIGAECGAFYAASELALIAEVWGRDLDPETERRFAPAGTTCWRLERRRRA